MLVKKPASGDTGENLEAGLTWLNSHAPKLFPSTHRYDYRITNAFAEPRARALGHNSSEAKDSEVRASENMARVIEELADCSLVLLCGRKAQLLSTAIQASGASVIKIPHPGHRGLNRAFPHIQAKGIATYPNQQRIELWAQAVLAACPNA